MPETSPWSPEVYAELRELAAAVMRRERTDHTLEPTALVNEAWLRLQASRNAGDLQRGAFLGLAAQAMRKILIDHARRRGAARRGAGQDRTTLSGKPAAVPPLDVALDIDAALDALARIDPDLARLVELRFFGGCDVEETAAVLGQSPRTVKRRWRFARAWLQHHMNEVRG